MRLLLVEDKDSFRRLLMQALAGTDWDLVGVGDPKEALEALTAGPFEVLVTDLRLPNMSGLELLKRAKRLQPALRIVLMSAFGEPKDIVEAMQSGADDFLPKPFDLNVFQQVLERLRALASAPPPDPREPWIVYSPTMRALDQALSRAAESEVPVIFTGERGTGRSRTARRLHTLRRAQAPYLALSAGGLGAEGPEPRRLELLKGGSLYLTDLDQLPAGSLAGLLKSMDTATGRACQWMGGCQDLAALPEELRLRLGVLHFHLPPLRERREDLLPLFRAFLEAAARKVGRTIPLVDRPLEKEILQRTWPGNLRELSWCVGQSLRTTESALLSSLPPPGLTEASAMHVPWPESGSLEAMLQSVQKSAEVQLLRRALETHGRNLGKTASTLGLTPRSLAQRLREHHISLEDG